MNDSTIDKVKKELEKRGIVITSATIREILDVYSKIYVAGVKK